VPVAPRMAERLWRLGADRPETERVFTSALGRALQRKNVHNRVLAPAHERAALPWVSFHTFTHTCASLLFDHGPERCAGGRVARTRGPGVPYAPTST